MKYCTKNNLLFYIFPTLFFVVLAILDTVLTSEQQANRIYHEVTGFIEYFHFVGGLLGAYFASILLYFSIKKQDVGLIIWFSLAVLGCFYVAGEEVSWGQHHFGWQPSEYWSLINDQNETNLHNTSSWFDQKPRLVLEIGMIVGGII